MDEVNSEQIQLPPQITERPMAVWVFGVLNIVFGCYPFIRTYPRLYKIIVPVLMSKTATPGILLFSLSCLIGIVLSIWLIVMGIGLLRMTKWARRWAIIYAWVQITLFVIAWGYNIIIVGCIFMPQQMAFLITSMLKIIYVMIYPVVLLIFMKTEKVKKAFAAIGG
jgi:hypothetical protein